MNKNLIYLTFLFLIVSQITIISSNADKCPVFSSKLQNDKYICSETSTQSEIKNYALSPCPLNGLTCNYLTLSQDNTTQCTKLPILPRLPGIRCYTNDNCANLSKCDVIDGYKSYKVCLGKKQDEVCTTTKECLQGFVCRKKDKDSASSTCLSPLNEDETCLNDFECANTLGCLNGKCVAYFSLDKNVSVEDIAGTHSVKEFSFCKSGTSLDNKCVEYKLLNTTPKKENIDSDDCTEKNTCEYSTSEKTVTLDEACECGYNGSGNKYCKRYSGDIDYTAYHNTLLKLINSNDCHSSERLECTKRYLNNNSNLHDTLERIKIRTTDYNKTKYALNEVLRTVYSPSYNYKAVNEINTCTEFTCNGSPDKNFCNYKTLTDKKIKAFITQCEDENTYCPFYSGLYGQKTSCENYDSTGLKSYPGYKCKNVNDCVEGADCIKNICINKIEGEGCSDNKECSIGFYCDRSSADKSSGVCKKQLEAQEKCSYDYECSTNRGCMNGKCVEYYSLKIGDKVTHLKTDHNIKELSFCETGIEYEGVCTTFKLISEADCTFKNYCMYENHEQKIIYLENTCECGYNGRKYCRKFAGDIDFSTYADNKKKQLTSNSCHTEERFVCKDSLLGDNLKIEKDLVKAVVESVEAHKFTDLNEDKECLINTIYPIIKNNPVPPVPPSKEVCRPFKCVDREDKDEPCIKEIKEKDKDSYFYELRKCYRWGRCFYDANSLFNSKTKELNATCGKKEDRKVGSVYPGEKCTNNDQCIEVDNSNLAINKNPFIKAIKQCTDGVCAGIGENKACSDTKSCLAGFFCDAVKKVCTKQIENKETTCSSTYECANNLACNGTCVEYNSVKIGEKLKTFSSNSNLVEQAKLLCEKGIAFEDGVCADSKYEDEVKVKDGVIECSADELCNYIYYSPDRNVKVSKKCLCGYNEEGKGYCPYATSVKQNFEKISNANKLFKDGSSCHTINRFDCNDFSRSSSYLTDRANGDVRFYNSPSCAINVLLSGNYVSVSLLGLILLSFLFLF